MKFFLVVMSTIASTTALAHPAAQSHSHWLSTSETIVMTVIVAGLSAVLTKRFIAKG